MHRSFKIILLSVIALAAVLLLRPNPSAAGDIILTHNRGGENAVFFVNDEPSLVINGFDLSPHTTRFPIALDAVSISVDRPAPGSRIDMVIYQDANGGSPVDASLVHRQSVQINRRGVQRFILNEAAIITEPVVWVGFYLPVGFRFHADTSGPSVLTYWAWAPGGTFPLDNLASAPVLGPGDGAEPVSIDMQGVARITAELRPLFHQEMASDAVLGNQLIAEGEQDTSLLQGYPDCGGLLFDPEDIAITSRASFTVHCGVASEFEAPTEIVHPDGHFLDLQRAGHLYKLEAQIPQAQLVHGAVNVMPVAVTHCIQIQAGHLEQAVIAEARGIPERWHALPSVRFEDVVCAEITTASYLSYFLPRGADSPPNVNLVMGWSKVSPHPLECGLPAYVEAPVTNTGQSWFSTVSGNVKFIIENIHVRSGITTGAVELSIETSQLGPGMRHILVFAPIYVTTYVNELHRLQVRADFDNQIQETNENDNVWFTEYILSNAQQSDRCFDIPWLTATPTAPYLVEGFCLVDIPRRHSNDRIVIRYSDACQIAEFKEQSHVEDPITWEHTMRDCRIRVRAEVVGQELRVRWSSSRPGVPEAANIIITRTPGVPVTATRVWNCAEGSFRSYRQKIELGGESVRQLVIDHDRPIPYALQTATREAIQTQTAEPTTDSTIRRPQIISGEYKAKTRKVEFEWGPVTGAIAYNFRYGRAGHVFRTVPVAVTALTHTLNVLDVDVDIVRGVDYVWEVQAKISDTHLGPWASGETFKVSKLPAPKMLTAVNTPFDGIDSSDKFGLAWGVVNEAKTPVAQYELQLRRVEDAWSTPTLVSIAAAEIAVTKSERYEWRVQARGGGEWAEATLPFSTRVLTAEAEAAIERTVDRIPSVTLMVDRVTTTPSAFAIRLSWNRGLGANAQYDHQWRVHSGAWQPATPARVVGAVPPAKATHIQPIGAANVGQRHEGRVRVVIGVAKGNWEETAELPPPPAPMNLRAIIADDSSVRFRWDAASDADSYQVRYRTGENNWTPPIAVSSGTDVTAPINNVDRLNPYEWQVRTVIDNRMDGIWSANGPWPPSPPPSQ